MGTLSVRQSPCALRKRNTREQSEPDEAHCAEPIGYAQELVDGEPVGDHRVGESEWSPVPRSGGRKGHDDAGHGPERGVRPSRERTAAAGVKAKTARGA